MPRRVQVRPNTGRSRLKPRPAAPAAKREAKTRRRNRSDPRPTRMIVSPSRRPSRAGGSALKRAKQSVPREFTRVASNLDESCGEEDFDKARISIDWLNTCLANYTKITAWGSAPETKAIFAQSIPGQTLVCRTNEGHVHPVRLRFAVASLKTSQAAGASSLANIFSSR